MYRNDLRRWNFTRFVFLLFLVLRLRPPFTSEAGGVAGFIIFSEAGGVAGGVAGFVNIENKEDQGFSLTG